MSFPVILCDPPWRYEVYSRDTGLGRSAESHYPTMTDDELRRLDVLSIAAPDCSLFMWATWPCLLQALALGVAWGFTYKTCAFLWAKTNKRATRRWTYVEDDVNWFVGMGYWTRANTEMCLLFTTGNPKRQSSAVRQLIVSPVREHSQKPNEQYERIEQLVAGPYCELFSRQKREGWQSWGNEIESDFILPVKESVDVP